MDGYIDRSLDLICSLYNYIKFSRRKALEMTCNNNVIIVTVMDLELESCPGDPSSRSIRGALLSVSPGLVDGCCSRYPAASPGRRGGRCASER